MAPPLLVSGAFFFLKKASIRLAPKAAKVASRLLPYYTIKWSAYYLLQRSIDEHGLPGLYRYGLKQNRKINATNPQTLKITEELIKSCVRAPGLAIDKRDEIDKFITDVILSERERPSSDSPEFLLSDLELYLAMRG
eukprot:CAMPEP_0182456672 /NCGR_PEP_ID=MMETSP1319-20130603/2458_1 /TAXON_ID=172717 /ORGANISM="Bolidomonas pacifica, Strain RCC208" /LENGTH=136 /DNA_ID=CAMNT_0024654981 /DNA_START=194 /DNA_END=601 /DNA_ORIENTATION=-